MCLLSTVRLSLLKSTNANESLNAASSGIRFLRGQSSVCWRGASSTSHRLGDEKGGRFRDEWGSPSFVHQDGKQSRTQMAAMAAGVIQQVIVSSGGWSTRGTNAPQPRRLDSDSALPTPPHRAPPSSLHQALRIAIRVDGIITLLVSKFPT
ncbi:hypothetical protein N657DRAFT_640877 [Parathielavia appendiculata]|uniref:Uncharacterized protein n=1 Tax=Parathielavia appendiculata TaxID=2587402 RepID=A0AAN6U5U8_9PEZI|nr:hypothetical protein N657DRAFT_640877 [Parathielavia appendiculata]